MELFDLLDCALTACDTEGVVIYQNERSVAVNGDVGGRSLLPTPRTSENSILHSTAP